MKDEKTAIELVKESRECIAACFRTMADSTDKGIIHRLEMQLALAGVKDGIGVRLQNFIASHSKPPETFKEVKAIMQA